MAGCGCGCSCSGGAEKVVEKKGLTEEQRAILQALVNIDGPCGTKDIAAESGLDVKDVTTKMASLKTKGYVDSPARCKYGITGVGKTALSS